jgi:hypothetical protein
VLPAFLNECVFSGIRLNDSILDVRLHRYGRDVAVNLLERSGDARLILSK